MNTMSNTNIIEKTGDILNEDTQAWVNAVNCVGVMGRGVALAFKNKHQENFKEYAKACAKGEVKPGKIFRFQFKPTSHQMECFDKGNNMLNGSNGEFRYIYNFPTKQHWRQKSQLTYIKDGLADLKRTIEQDEIRSIAIPALGCGLGGLDWNEVRPLITEYLNGIDHLDYLVIFWPGHCSNNKKSKARNKSD